MQFKNTNQTNITAIIIHEWTQHFYYSIRENKIIIIFLPRRETNITNEERDFYELLLKWFNFYIIYPRGTGTGKSRQLSSVLFAHFGVIHL